MDTDQLVLVTGGSGFLGAHCIAAALERGLRVRTTVRSLERAGQVRQMVDRAGQDGNRVEFAACDLTSDDGWREAMQDVDLVLHVASPLPQGEPKDPDEVIRPAREGAMRALRAARDAGVRRVVLTSAFGAVGFGWGPTTHRFTEDDWTPLDGPGVNTYNVSKTLAEQAAWDYVGGEGHGLELVTLCPVAVFGPVLGGRVSGGNDVVRMLLAGKLPGTIDLWFPIVDVRDVAAAHVAAALVPEAAGQRFIVGSGEGLTMAQIARLLRDELGDDARRVTTRRIPTGLLRAVGRFVPQVRVLAEELGYSKDIDVSRAPQVLVITMRPAREAVLASARSILDRGIVARP